MKTLEALHTLMYAEKSEAWASLFSGVRVRYTTEHWNLGVDTMEDAIKSVLTIDKMTDETVMISMRDDGPQWNSSLTTIT